MLPEKCCQILHVEFLCNLLHFCNSPMRQREPSVCVCVCVYERERERRGENENEWERLHIMGKLESNLVNMGTTLDH